MKTSRSPADARTAPRPYADAPQPRIEAAAAGPGRRRAELEALRAAAVAQVAAALNASLASAAKRKAATEDKVREFVRMPRHKQALHELERHARVRYVRDHCPLSDDEEDDDFSDYTRVPSDKVVRRVLEQEGLLPPPEPRMKRK